jgi:hypothetical protein
MARHHTASVMAMGAGRRLGFAFVLAIVIWGCVLWAV